MLVGTLCSGFVLALCLTAPVGPQDTKDHPAVKPLNRDTGSS